MKLKLFSVFIVIALILWSCKKKKESDIGQNILPASDLLNAIYCDTSTILAYTILDDTLRTDESYTGNVANLVGILADPIFGKTDASIYFNLSNPNNTTDIGFGASAKLDSVVLTLAYQKNTYYGDPNDALLFNVYRITEQMYYDSAYYSYSTRTYNALEDITYFGTGQVVKIDPTTNVYEGDTKYAPHLRIRLKNAIGQLFLDDSTHLKNTETLRQFFNGLHVTAKNTIVSGNDYGAIGYFDLTSPLSKITIYYHNGTNFTTKKLDLTIASNSAKFNHYNHDYSAASPLLTQQFPPTNNTILGNTTVFMQGTASTRIKIKLPYLKNLSDSGKIAVNKAELIFKVDMNPAFYDATKFFVPAKTALEGVRLDGTTLALSLDQYWDLTGMWGYYDATNYEYHFPIPSSVQRMANGVETDLMFTLRVFQHHTNPARVVLGGKDNAAYPAKLKIWYTRVGK